MALRFSGWIAILLLGCEAEAPKPVLHAWAKTLSPASPIPELADASAPLAEDSGPDAEQPQERYSVQLRKVGKQRFSLGKDPSDGVEIADNRIVFIDREQGTETEVGKNDEKAGCLSLWSPHLVDPKTILVECLGYEAQTIHNRSVCLIDIPSKKLHLLGRRTHCALPITKGRYKGHFFVDAMDFKIGQGIWDAPRIVTRTGRSVKELDENPFRGDWNGDGLIMDDEMNAPCVEPPLSKEKLEAIMKKL